MSSFQHQTTAVRAGVALAFTRREGARAPTIVWLGGFRSDMTGAKATRLDAAARRAEYSFVRFDYTGCGASGGAFEDGDIDVWREDTLHVLDTLTQGPVVLVGSSMGGWMALLAALARPARVKALVLIAPAPDFTERLILHGQRDEAVPWRQSLELAERLETDDVRVTFIKSGDHRLSALHELALMEDTVLGVCSEVGDDRTT